MVNQRGATPLILVFGIIGLLTIMFIANAAPFKGRFLTSFYPKDQSYASTLSAPQFKIMPVGDSLTHGVKNSSSDPDNVMAGYRYYLYKNLIAGGTQVDMVGSLSSGPSDLVDKNHDGYNGHDCLMISNLVNSTAATYKPDVVLLMCGVNDFAQQRTEQFREEAISHLEKVIDNISTVSPNTKIIVATIVNSNLSYKPNLPNDIKNFNAKIPELIVKKSLEGKKVYLVDMYNALTLSDLSDTVHPNEEGYQKMSDVWQNILKQVLANANPSGIVANYSYVKPGYPQTVSWFNLANNSGASWIGLYKSDTPESQFGGFITWFYLGNCQNNQGTPTASPKIGICTTQVPPNLAEGQYEFRLYLQGTTLAQKSNKFTVSSLGLPLVSPPPVQTPTTTPTPTPTSNPVNNVTVSPGTVNKLGTIQVNWGNLTNPGGSSWFGLFPANSASNASGYIDWSYMGSCSKLNGTTPQVTGSCQFTIPSATTSGSYEIRIFLQGTSFTAKSAKFQVN